MRGAAATRMLEGVTGAEAFNPQRDQERNRLYEQYARALFDTPDLARAVVQRVDANGGNRPRISSILLDNATIDHALRYFDTAGRELSGSQRPARPRLMMLAVAELVNAFVLYERVLTGPEAGTSSYTQTVGPGGASRAAHAQILGDAAGVIRVATEKMTWPEVLAVLGLAKATCLATVGGQGHTGANGQSQVEVVSGLLGLPLEPDLVLAALERLTPHVAHQSPHKMRWIARDRDFYPRNFATLLLARSQTEVTSTDGTPERFAAQLIYRAQVYSLLADMLGCPYSADALRAELVEPRGPSGFAERAAVLIGDAEAETDHQINQVLGYEAFKIRIPLVLRYVLSRASRPAEVLEITLEIRDSRQARRFREYCARVDAAIAEGKRADVVRACKELSAYGVRFESELAGSRPNRDQMVGAAKDLVSIGSPVIGALIPGAAIAGSLVGGWVRRRRYALIERMIGAPRTLNAIEHEFAHLWPHL
ncbi:hypothetical protein [Actinomadura sp. NPDC000929]|uniref:hypothetical protein n=1 Tax=Actinomadura sp. NPDC000929 TaxID=3154517 RepID=UPI003393766B